MILVTPFRRRRAIWRSPDRFFRRHISPAQEAAAIARRKDAFEALHPETRHGIIGNGRE